MLKPVLVNEKINLKIFQNIKNKKEFKNIISCLKSKEIKFVATYLMKVELTNYAQAFMRMF